MPSTAGLVSATASQPHRIFLIPLRRRRIYVHNKQFAPRTGRHPHQRVRRLGEPLLNTSYVGACVLEAVLGEWTLRFALLAVDDLIVRAAREDRKTVLLGKRQGG